MTLTDQLSIVADLNDAIFSRIAELNARCKVSQPYALGIMLFTFGKTWRAEFFEIKAEGPDPLAALLALERQLDARDQAESVLARTLGIDA